MTSTETENNDKVVKIFMTKGVRWPHIFLLKWKNDKMKDVGTYVIKIEGIKLNNRIGTKKNKTVSLTQSLIWIDVNQVNRCF